jgi:hypothetical protein
MGFLFAMSVVIMTLAMLASMSASMMVIMLG